MIIESLELKITVIIKNYISILIRGPMCFMETMPRENQYPGICLCMRNDKITPGKQGQGDYRIRGGRIPY